jgi:pimeloyl-ACP methyl ester carboxylesterase
MLRVLLATLAAVALAPAAYGASVDGIDLYSSSAGSGPTIVFVHGWTCDTSSWREQVPAFEDDYRVITLDLPGHGRSGSPAQGDFSMDLFARAVEAVRAEAGADRIVLVGHSMGVPVIRQYAITYPDRVAGLVAVDGPLDLRAFGAAQGGGTPPAMTREMREGMIRGMFVPETPADLQAHILSMMLGTPEATANGAAAAMFDPAIRTADVIEAPALAVVAGTAELPDVAATKAIVPQFEARQVEGTGHFLMMEKPAEFNRLLEEFLQHIAF